MLKGAITALITPFDKNGNIDFIAMEKIIEYQIQNKIDGLVVCGTTGESATLSDNEKKELIQFVVKKVNKRVPVIAGTGSNNTKHSIELSKYAESVGVDYLLLVTPYYNKTNQKGLIEHYTAIANSVKTPCILYNVPSRTGVDMLPETVLELSKVPNIIGINEASNNFSNILKICSKKYKDFLVFSGNDDSIIPLLSLGGNGVISVLSNVFPEEVHNMCKYYFENNIAESTNLQFKFANVIFSLFSDVNPIPIKEAMYQKGFCTNTVRLPLIQLTAEKKECLKNILNSI